MTSAPHASYCTCCTDWAHTDTHTHRDISVTLLNVLLPYKTPDFVRCRPIRCMCCGIAIIVSLPPIAVTRDWTEPSACVLTEPTVGGIAPNNRNCCPNGVSSTLSISIGLSSVASASFSSRRPRTARNRPCLFDEQDHQRTTFQTHTPQTPSYDLLHLELANVIIWPWIHLEKNNHGLCRNGAFCGQILCIHRRYTTELVCSSPTFLPLWITPISWIGLHKKQRTTSISHSY